jgi:methyl-accepting chemotaxis protein
MRVSVGAKLGIGFVIVVGLFLLIAFNGAWRSTDVDTAIDELFDRGTLEIQRIATLQLNMQRIRTGMYQHAATVDPGKKETLDKGMDQLETETRQLFRALEERLDPGDPKLAKVQTARGAWERYDSIRREEVLPLSYDRDPLVYESMSQRLAPLFDEASDQVSELLSAYVAENADIKDNAAAVLDESRRISLIGSLMGATLAALVAAGVSRDVSARIGALAQGARAAAERRTFHPIEAQGSDEIADLARLQPHDGGAGPQARQRAQAHGSAQPDAVELRLVRGPARPRRPRGPPRVLRGWGARALRAQPAGDEPRAARDDAAGARGGAPAVGLHG